MRLPEARKSGAVSLEEALNRRRSIRSYSSEPVTLEELSQLLWAAQGITGKNGFRAAPSAGATYPLETYVIIGDVVGLEPGFYRYEPANHSLALLKKGDMRPVILDATLSQPCIKSAAVILVFTAVYERTTERYGDRGKMYVHMDVGFAAENALLQVAALSLASVPVGAFRTKTLGNLLGLPESELPMCLLPIGRP